MTTTDTNQSNDDDQTTNETPQERQERPSRARSDEPGAQGAPTRPEAATSDPDDQSSDDGQEEGEQDRGRGNREAARYRTRLRDVETERDALAGRVEQLQRAEVERLATDLAQPADLFDVGRTQLEDLLDEDGNVDAGKVAQASRELLATRPGLHAQAKTPGPDMGQGGRGVHEAGRTTWAGYLQR